MARGSSDAWREPDEEGWTLETRVGDAPEMEITARAYAEIVNTDLAWDAVKRLVNNLAEAYDAYEQDDPQRAGRALRRAERITDRLAFQAGE